MLNRVRAIYEARLDQLSCWAAHQLIQLAATRRAAFI